MTGLERKLIADILPPVQIFMAAPHLDISFIVGCPHHVMSGHQTNDFGCAEMSIALSRALNACYEALEFRTRYV